MSHVDPELLALLALGEQLESAADRAHVDGCAECAAELEHLSRTAAIARTTLDEGELLVPSRRVWHRISDELSLEAEVAPPAAVQAIRPRQTRRWVRPFVAAAAVVALVGGGIGLGAWLGSRPDSGITLASATLDPFPEWSGASGSAVVAEDTTGERTVQVDLSAPAREGDYREVWLISSDVTELVSLGVVNGDRATLAIPEGVDLARYDLVDISSEPYDGDPAHSGDSIVRGQLG